MADYTDPGLALKKLASNVKVKLASKMDEPTGKTGQLVYNATTDTWEAALTGGSSDTTLTLTYAPATGKWTWVDANKVTQTLSASNQPAWSSYTNVLPMAPDVLDLSTVDMSLIPTQYPIFVPLSAADAAGLVTVVGGGGAGNATMNPIPYADLAVV